MTQIIRLEHENSGDGLFRHQDDFGKAIYRQLNCFESLRDRYETFKTPYEEPLLKREMSEKYYCAFKSLDQLSQWITSEEMMEILDYGFKIYVIDIEIYHEGEYQIIFKKEDIISKKDITDLFK